MLPNIKWIGNSNGWEGDNFFRARKVTSSLSSFTASTTSQLCVRSVFTIFFSSEMSAANMAEAMKATVAAMLKGIDRYNPENLSTLEKYIEIQARENAYDLEANLAVLKLYQFNPNMYQSHVVQYILLKALTNLPHTDFVLCKCLIETHNLEAPGIKNIVELHDLLETCQFLEFWNVMKAGVVSVAGITGFDDSIRKFICHVVNITYQHIDKNDLSAFLGGLSDYHLRMWMNKYGWKEIGNNAVLISNQEENIKTKNITEKIEFESVAAILSACR